MVASLKEITKTYYMGTLSVEVLHGISLDFYSGDYISIMGPSGCGKSTLMNIPVGALDDHPGCAVKGHVYVSSKAPWFELTDALPCYAEMPSVS